MFIIYMKRHGVVFSSLGIQTKSSTIWGHVISKCAITHLREGENSKIIFPHELLFASFASKLSYQNISY